MTVARSKGLLRTPADGGPPESLPGLTNGESTLAFPQILPGGKAIFFLNRDPRSDRVVRRVHQILLGTEIPFRRLHGSMAKKHLNLLKFAATGAA